MIFTARSLGGHRPPALLQGYWKTIEKGGVLFQGFSSPGSVHLGDKGAKWGDHWSRGPAPSNRLSDLPSGVGRRWEVLDRRARIGSHVSKAQWLGKVLWHLDSILTPFHYIFDSTTLTTTYQHIFISKCSIL